MTKVFLMVFSIFLMNSSLMAAEKESECKIKPSSEKGAYNKVARVEYVRSSVIKSLTVAPNVDAHYEETTYVDSCYRLRSSGNKKIYNCFNPLYEIEILVSFIGDTLRLYNEDFEVYSEFECQR